MKKFRARITPGSQPTMYPIMSIEIFVQAASKDDAFSIAKVTGNRTWQHFFITVDELYS